MFDGENTFETLKLVAPGTELRAGLDNILHAGKGALVVAGDSEEVLKIVDGGFYINCDYDAQKIYELAKMDGAIILSENLKKILYANVQLQPDSTIETQETGTRHRTAERVAKQTGILTISISERRRLITLYKDENRYKLKKIADIIAEANQALKTLERYRTVLEKSLTNLSIMEFDELVTLYEVTNVVQLFSMMFKIYDEAQHYVLELGDEGRLIALQLEELIKGMVDEMEAIISDYHNSSEDINTEKIAKKLRGMSIEELGDVKNISSILEYGTTYSTLDKKITPKGYRQLGKIFKLTKRDIIKLIDTFEEFNSIFEASIGDLSEIKGISKLKAKAIISGLKRLQATMLLEK